MTIINQLESFRTLICKHSLLRHSLGILKILLEITYLLAKYHGLSGFQPVQVALLVLHNSDLGSDTRLRLRLRSLQGVMALCNPGLIKLGNVKLVVSSCTVTICTDVICKLEQALTKMVELQVSSLHIAAVHCNGVLMSNRTYLLGVNSDKLNLFIIQREWAWRELGLAEKA